eukprot:CAMPEP_0174820142 /NCGR_PEP_ID=MMETSP1107-20130205/3774_1 /TAXON_ID=36770 /ORGANISM="Paraphysomonas vestita, Strain GFlagA" /LENGTH=282 /DNA_ID=CAMNT_0016034899 /DNA_START=172 /DNA_END=1020 /DNA_ORIENTATION=+
MQTITRVKVQEVKIKVPKRVLARKNLPKFGDVTEGEVNVTLLSPDFVGIEHPDDQQAEDAEDPALGNTLANFILKQQERAIERENDISELIDSIDEDRLASQPQSSSNDNENKEDNSNAGGANTSGKYVPPAARARQGDTKDRLGDRDRDRDHETTIRVSNLTKAVTEEDLRALFQRFGTIHRVSLPKSERKLHDGTIVKEPRGFAYIAFARKEDAERAMERLQGHGYDHLILKLEWAKPPSADAPPSGGGLQGGYISGYGTKLAQDTKESVLYASNLTGNR